jgi:hypothetical protein
MQPAEWIVGVTLNDGSYDVLTHDSRINPARIDDVVFPLSLPWKNEPALYVASLQEVAVDGSRDSGPERHYSAYREETVPNSDQLWNIELELWEYPPNVFNTSRLQHTEQIRGSRWKRDDLLDAIKRSF